MTEEQKLLDCLSNATELTVYAIEPPERQEDWDTVARQIRQIIGVAKDMLEHGSTFDSVEYMILTGIANYFPQKPTVDFVFNDKKVMVVLDYVGRTGNTFIHTDMH